MIFWQVTALIYKLEQTIHFIQEQKDSLGGYRGSSWLQTSGVKPVPLNSLKYLQLVGLSPYQLGQGGQHTGQFFENYLLLLVVLDLRCCTRAFSGCGEHGLLVVVASPGAEHRLQVPGSQQWWCTGCRCPQHADPPPQTRGHTHIHSTGRWIPIHGTTREILCQFSNTVLYTQFLIPFPVFTQTFHKIIFTHGHLFLTCNSLLNPLKSHYQPTAPLKPFLSKPLITS